MGYTYISPLGSTPEERLKAVEGYQDRPLGAGQTKEERKAFCDAMFAAESIIMNRVDGDDVYTYDAKAKGDKELTAAQKADLASRYDFSNLTQDQLTAFLSELSLLGVVKGGICLIAETDPLLSSIDVFTWEDLHGKMTESVTNFNHLLKLLYAHPNPNLLAIDDLQQVIANYEKLDKIFKEFMAPDV